MWLLDGNQDVHLVETLKGLGVSCDTAARGGWQTLSNGDLVSAAVVAGFTCLLTRDRLFGESAARALKAVPTFSAVVVVNLPQRPWEANQKQFIAAWNAEPIHPVPGKLIRWPANR